MIGWHSALALHSWIVLSIMAATQACPTGLPGLRLAAWVSSHYPMPKGPALPPCNADAQEQCFQSPSAVAALALTQAAGQCSNPELSTKLAAVQSSGSSDTITHLLADTPPTLWRSRKGSRGVQTATCDRKCRQSLFREGRPAQHSGRHCCSCRRSAPSRRRGW